MNFESTLYAIVAPFSPSNERRHALQPTSSLPTYCYDTNDRPI
jgi:hypothetical protein